MRSIRPPRPLPSRGRQLAQSGRTAVPLVLPSVQCHIPVTVLVADKPVFGADITLNENWANQSMAFVSAGQPLAWLAADLCASLFLQGTTIRLSTLFSTGQLILSPTRAMTLFRCHRLDYTSHLFCFSLSARLQCSFCSSIGHQ
ncbi:hypothetical protein HHX48_00620 [Salinimonas sp. HHU 13199]|uniref:Uncharacterized protein n=1 Tax=Salinimonas profundi TaxID=2729140 RepID=A0ABR8LD43_9ALTE|nr:hypothetical protein [Salinimonas profundi]MBD3584236.1 hypothetical protein [Salinimonas profundi]